MATATAKHTPGSLDSVTIGANASGRFHQYLIDSKGRKIGALWGGGEEKAANADRIILAWNTHADLVAALKAQELADIALEDQSDNFEAWQKLDDEAKRLRAAALAKVEARQ
jgi:hypothetical protein